MSRRLSGLSLSLPLIFLGCAPHTANQQPQPLFELPETYSTAVSTEARETNRPWWESFGDPQLDALVETALEQNFTLAQGLTRIRRAQSLLRQARALRLPHLELNADASADWEKIVDAPEPEPEPSGATPTFLSDSGTDGSAKQTEGGGEGGGSGGSSGSSESAEGREDWDSEFSTGLALRWELDLWGRLRSEASARREEWVALTLDYEALRLFLSAQVAEAYYQILEQRLQYALLQEQRESVATLLELLELRFLQAGASVVDVLQQRGQLAEIESEMPVALAQMGLLENRLDVLLGTVPDGADRTAEDSAALPQPEVLPALGVPLSLLQQRPDLEALQRIVVAGDHRITAAIAERLPQVTLDGSFRYSDAGNTSRLLGSTSAGLLQPLLDWGLRKAAVEAARADFEEILLGFSQAYLTAIEEVETTLWQEARQRELLEALRAREEILEHTVEETRMRYSLGASDYLPVLSAAQELLDLQREILEERRALVSLRIQLHRAIGGATDSAARTVESSRLEIADEVM